jgi:hypothetical protein
VKGYNSNKIVAIRAVTSPEKAYSSSEVDRNRRLERWQLQHTAQKLLPQERVAFCLRRMQSNAVHIMHSPEKQTAHYQGLMTCGSVWVCPMCAAKISERRRNELEQAIEQCVANGGAVYLATYTVSHKHYDHLSVLLDSFLAARKRARQGRAAQDIRQRFGIIGTVSVREVTWVIICDHLTDKVSNYNFEKIGKNSSPSSRIANVQPDQDREL